jgi:hypothetical protein
MLEVLNHGKESSMATQRREERERRAKRQGSGIRKEGGDEFKASPTRGRIKEKVLLQSDGRDEVQIDFRENCKRPKQSD